MTGYHLALVYSLDSETTPELTGPAMAVLKSHAWHANDAGLSWPSIKVIKRETRLGLGTITRAHKLLEDHGWLARKRRYNTSTLYRINVAKLEQHRIPQASQHDLCEDLSFADADAVVSGHSDTVQPKGSSYPQGDTASDQCINQSGWTHQPEWLDTSTRVVGHINQSGQLTNKERRKKISLSEERPHEANSCEGTKERSSSPETHPEPSQEALAMVAALSFGRHRRPNLREARNLARQVDAAIASGLTLAETHQHAQAAIAAARPPDEGGNAVAYVAGALMPDRLPIPVPKEPTHTPTSTDSKPADIATVKAAMAAIRETLDNKRPRHPAQVANR